VACDYKRRALPVFYRVSSYWNQRAHTACCTRFYLRDGRTAAGYQPNLQPVFNAHSAYVYSPCRTALRRCLWRDGGQAALACGGHVLPADIISMFIDRRDS